MELFIILYVIFLSYFILLLGYNLYLIIKGYAPSLSSSKKAVKDISKIYNFPPNIHVADFGAGHGKIINHLKNYDIKITGYEINPLLFYFLKFRFRNHNNVKIINQDFLTSDVSLYNVITIYGVGDIMPKLENIIKDSETNDLKVISNKFTFPTINHKKKIGGVYLYEI